MATGRKSNILSHLEPSLSTILQRFSQFLPDESKLAWINNTLCPFLSFTLPNPSIILISCSASLNSWVFSIAISCASSNDTPVLCGHILVSAIGLCYDILSKHTFFLSPSCVLPSEQSCVTVVLVTHQCPHDWENWVGPCSTSPWWYNNVKWFAKKKRHDFKYLLLVYSPSAWALFEG